MIPRPIEITNPSEATRKVLPRRRVGSISRPARKRRNAKPRIESTWTAESTSTQPSPEGPTTMPATISSTTAGSRRAGASPRVSGARNATTTTMSRFVKWTSTMPPQSRGGAERYAGDLADLVVEAEDRQVHRDDDEADHAADDHDHQRLDEGRQRLDLGVDLGLVEVGDLREHVLERPGFLAHGDHVRDHRREDWVVRDRLGDRAAALHRLVHLVHRVLDDGVAGRDAGNVDRLEDRHARGDHSGEGPRPASERDLLDDVADARNPKLEPIPLAA